MRWALCSRAGALAALLALALSGGAQAASTQFSNCSQTVGTSAAAVPFPASGSTGNPRPNDYLLICNAHASNTLGINSSGGTAAINSAGTVEYQPGGCMLWDSNAVPSAVSVIGSGASTTTACSYH